MRLFFALRPPLAVAEALASARDGLCLQGRLTPSANLHITVAFLGSLPAVRLPAVIACARPEPVPPVRLQLQRLGAWHGGRVCFVAPAEVPQALLAWRTRLTARLRAEVAPALDSRPWRPHLTLARGALQGPDEGQPGWRSIVWDVRTFSLMASDLRGGGPIYTQLAHFQDDGAGADG